MPNGRSLFRRTLSPSLRKYRAWPLTLLLIVAMVPCLAAPATAAETGNNGASTGTVTLSVIGDAKRGTLLPATQMSLQDGDTAYSALERTLSGKVMSSGSGETLYVSSIDGLSELDLGPKSGWMYEVNGAYPPGSASIYRLKPGDAVVWRYTLDLGADVGAPDPGAGGNAPGGASGGTDASGNGSAGDGGNAGNGGGHGAGEGASAAYDADIAALRKLLLAKPAAELSEWEAFALGRSGGGVPDAYLTELAAQVKAAGGAYRKATDLERIVLAVRAAGADPRAFAGYDLVAAVYNHDKLTLQGANGPIFALLALDSGGYVVPASAIWTRAKLVDWLLALQNADGSFPLAAGEAGNADITAMALAALAPYANAAEDADAGAGAAGTGGASSAAAASAAIDRAVAYVSAVQLPNGGFKLERDENSETAAQVVIGLTAAGRDPAGAAFVKTGGSLLDALIAYRTADGRFAHTPGGAADPIATEQAMLALIAYDRFATGAPGLYRIAAERFADERQIAGWASEAVHQAYAAKLLSGTSAFPLRFEPKRAITRAEFAALLVRLAGDRLNAVPSPGAAAEVAFADVQPSAWYYAAVMRAARADIVNGVSATSFKPGDPITREQMAVMIGRAFGLSESQSGTAWRDASSIRAAALPYVNAVADKGILLGAAGAFEPSGTVTREMAAVTAVRLKHLDLVS
ncbi:Prenyltransferase and squalene oxidase repeat-containing protein [Cohnella sp. OV330]|uniref:S-layer homology domain-containing protein n=1 Tax=Cohnella sp. OV330 TaxID=1855288 RepID=UPI0008F2E4BE|nr:S-layer homology domain-containing protein [Cohnella sp. OV330]SFB55729.1 Prenyltransferase and squalene oxidase repeat-containing protein [Cohnella sp. OV330]